MPNFAVVDMEGKQVGSIDLSESVFGIEPNTAVMHQMVVNYLANQRHGTQSALTRAEVSGGGRNLRKNDESFLLCTDSLEHSSDFLCFVLCHCD